MADLSPAALSVWCRFCEVVEEHGPPRLGLAAALRAAADQVVPVPIKAQTSEEHWAVLGAKNRLLAIADELEGHG